MDELLTYKLWLCSTEEYHLPLQDHQVLSHSGDARVFFGRLSTSRAALGLHRPWGQLTASTVVIFSNCPHYLELSGHHERPIQ